ncbi:MAG: FKBP-type peptidyl-prolyl cis-trans isomerase [Bacteroidales bacterium]|nr:FKBP-type peptidyl-prolyl cis-trans isomerase [Bacteroidales bacterium]
MKRVVNISSALAALFAAALVLLASCQSENALAVVNQEAAIDKYITSKYPDNEVVRNGGTNRVIVMEGDASCVAAPGDSIRMNIEGNIFTTSPSTRFVTGEYTVELGSKDLMKGLEKGLEGVAEGEECYIFFSAKYGYYDSPVGIVPSMSALMFHVNVLEIKKK